MESRGLVNNPRLKRRQLVFLAGGAGLGILLAACSSAAPASTAVPETSPTKSTVAPTTAPAVAPATAALGSGASVELALITPFGKAPDPRAVTQDELQKKFQD